ncbi:MAG: hypothetical protein ACRD6B_03480 [Bryobacteraceae bacterium]
MKDGKQKESVAKPLLKSLVDRKKTNSKIEKPSIGSKPLKPAALYQDAGGGYNPDFTFPQE